MDQLWPSVSGHADPYLMMIGARVKSHADAVYVRDQILKACSQARMRPVDGQRLADAQSNARYGLVRGLDSTEAIAAMLARFMRYSRSYDTLNRLFRVYAALTPDDLLAAAKNYLTDERLVLTTLSREAMPESMAQVPRLATWLVPRRLGQGLEGREGALCPAAGQCQAPVFGRLQP